MNSTTSDDRRQEDNSEVEMSGSGGAATAGGIWYQALYSVLLAVEKRLAYASQSEVDAPAQFIAEPSDGGDLRVKDIGRHRVIQFKKKDDGGAWSLKKLIDEVLPDLFKATAKVPADNEVWSFEFVTAGRIGRWHDAYDLFQCLGGRTRVAEAAGSSWEKAYEALDDQTPLRIVNSDLSSEDQKTARRLFDFIVGRLRGNEPEDGKPDNRLSLEETRAQTWRLLCGFKFVGDRSADWCESQLRSHLLRISDTHTKVDHLLKQMVGTMIKASRVNDATFSPPEVLKAAGLDGVVALGDLTTLSAHCRERMSQAIRQRGYVPEHDVRRHRWIQEFASTAPILITGDSGNGKSWSVYAAADTATTPAVVLIDARELPALDAESIVQKAAEQVWKIGLRHDTPTTMDTLVQRLDEVLGSTRGTPWLTLCVDHVDDPVLARALVVQPWSSWGVRLVVGLSSNARGAAEQAAAAGNPGMPAFDTRIFTLPELQAYFGMRLGKCLFSVLPHPLEAA